MSHDVLCRPADDLASLLDRCGQGDEQAFTPAVRRDSPSRLRGGAARGEDQKLAEDVTQEAYLELWRESRRYDSARRSAMGLLLTMLHRRAVDRLRSAQATTRREEAYFRREQATPELDTTSATGSRST